MNPLVEQHIDGIRALCQEYGVTRLELFGSAATDAFDPDRSDIDFIVEYPRDYEFGPWLSRFFELRECLESLLCRPVDLVMASALRKPRFLESANATRRLLYAA